MAVPTFAVLTGAAHASCRRPDTAALIGDRAIGFERTLITPIAPRGADLRWVSVSGTSQMIGDVFVVDCHGAERAEAGLGYVERQMLGPEVAGQFTLIANYHTASGTGINEQDVAILQYSNGKIIRMWDHKSFEGEYPPEDSGLGRQKETTYHWRFTSGSRGIEVTGRDVVLLGGHKRRIHHLISEKFCLNDKSLKYLPCR
jgi:hypothetical protein